MFRRFGHLLLIVALLGATGTHWALLQSVAWANMLAAHARTEPLKTAIAETFDGRHPCPLCKRIEQGRNSEKKSDAQTSMHRLEFPCQLATGWLFPPQQFSLLTGHDDGAAFLSHAPPVPPPRSLQG